MAWTTLDARPVHDAWRAMATERSRRMWVLPTSTATATSISRTPPASSATWRSASIDHIYGDVFDHHTCVFEYASGARIYGMVRTQHGCHGEVATKLFGTKGSAHVDGNRIWGAVNWHYEGRSPGGHQHEQTEFMAALRSGKTIDNGLYMARSTLIGIMGQLACYTGKKIDWKQVCESRFSYPPTSGEIDFNTEPPVKAGPHGIYSVPVPGKSQMI